MGQVRKAEVGRWPLEVPLNLALQILPEVPHCRRPVPMWPPEKEAEPVRHFRAPLAALTGSPAERRWEPELPGVALAAKAEHGRMPDPDSY